ncbi:MAG: TrkH family potassium uptake protein, partial [Planctomycetaceae bacterium]
GVMLTPLLTLLAWPEELSAGLHFLIPGLLLLCAGATAYFRFKSPETVLSLQDGGLIVVLTWLGASLAGTWPLMAVEELNFTQATFESVSGWTTTGLSVIDVTQAHKMTLMWRSIMQVVGGAGFAIIMLAAMTGPVGTGLSTAEGRSEQLVPHMRKSAKLVLMIYGSYLGMGSVALFLAGMDWFDAINHSFCAVSTGGFSTRPESIGHWNSLAVEAVILPLMLLGSLNFLTAYTLWRSRLLAILRDSEIRLVAVFVPLIALLLFMFVCRELYPTLNKAIRVAIFETVSCMTTTGFSTVSYSDWNAFGILMLIVFMVVGGGTGSTAGGMKQFRIVLLAKSFVWDIRRLLMPASAVVENHVWHSGEREYIDDGRLRQTTAFATLYLLTLVLGTAVIAAHGYSLSDSFFEFASAQGTVGLSVGVTSVDAPPLVLWTEIAGMFLGRLEFLIVFVSLTKIVRDIPPLMRTGT